ncbi:RagB/SusD family nutrient uptake outer membrane protein [Bacteroides hominis]|uniref:RagB/SusD family nutrient uptake outer membrane protein n=1 Tax=Bacteroides hominis TaxID=2763023 RepID=UPI00294A797F|nr:RagB/SusD family nutrient uptake outer membrane protein [Bacteroides hominis (ex Liu et al. 2022)]MDV6184594.1 RagB/SusD family nutrient uptake outer membrane protein [Bacteroides hominis (ex Liu et al. 2022)]
MKNILLILAISISFASCSLDRNPKDALSTATFPKTEKDIEMLAVGCYDSYVDQNFTVYNDVLSDNGYCAINTNWSAYANGKATHSNPGIGWFDYTLITRCNKFLSLTETTDIPFKDARRLVQLRNEVRFLRAWRYYMMATAYGDIPLITGVVSNLDESKVPATAEADVIKFVLDELDDISAEGALDVTPKESGRITRGAALALKMRVCLYYKKYDDAIAAADAITNLGIYDLYKAGSNPYADLFKEANEDNCEIILAGKKVENDYKNQTIIEFCNANDGGWSAFVPIQSLVDAYEMASGLTIEEAEKIGEYDPVHPYKGRDPRFYATILYSGADWVNPNGVYRIYNTLDKTIDGKSNKDNANDSRNASQSGYTCCKYMSPLTQYSDINNTGLDFIVFRYAEVLLSKAEALIELNKDFDEVYKLMNQIRRRAGMPDVDRAKYASQADLRKLLRRERRVEFAFEGLRRSDIVRWGIALDVLNGPIYATNYGTVTMDTSIPQEERAVIKPGEENRVVLEIRSAKNTYLPIPQSELDRNPKLKQTNFK